jgi:hypothetical protein
MLDTPSTPLAAGIGSAIISILFLGFGYLVVDAIAGRSDLGPVTRLGLAFPAVAGFACILEVLQIVTGGAVFSSAVITRGLTLLTAAVLVGWKVLRGLRHRRAAVDAGAERGRGERQWVGLALVLVLVVGAGLLWGARAFQQLPLDQNGDTPSHMGLSTQLLNGETTPSAAISGQIPNGYPWLFNATIALLARFTPGGRAYHALNALQVLLPMASILGLFALGWELVRRWDAAAAAAVFGGIVGGVGLRYPFGLPRRPYNVAMANLSPPYPRDLTLVLLVGFLVLATVGVVKGSVRTLICAGVVLGLAGLTGAESFFVGALVAGAMVLLPNEKIGRGRAALALLVPAMAVYALWLVPLVVSYLRLGGFVNITRVGPVNLSPLGILKAWGITTVFGAYGFVRWAPRLRRHSGARVAVVVFAAAGAMLLLSSVIPGVLGQAFLALGRRHRYWPLLHLGVALLAALGVSDLVQLAGRARRGISIEATTVLAAVVLFFGLQVPLRLATSTPSHRGPVLTAALQGDPGSVLNVMSSVNEGEECVAAVPAGLQIPAFAYTGYRLVVYRWPGYKTNLARIRWADIYEHIPSDGERIESNAILVGGKTDPETWRSLVARFGVNIIMVNGVELSPVFDPYPKTPAHGTGRDYTVVRVKPCR